MNSDELIQIEEEAATWAARLRGGGMTDADREKLGSWLELNPEHQVVLARYRELSASLDLGFAQQQATGRTRRRKRWRATAVATTLAAAAAIAFGAYVARPTQYDTGLGERRVVALADGSRIELNAQTKMSVSIGRHERKVRLSQGEALFTVARDVNRPFFVETSAGEVRVTGTVFNVRTEPNDQVEVTVIEGHVQVRPSEAPALGAVLDSDGQADFAPAQLRTRVLPPAQAQDSAAWRNGQVVFEDTPLAEAFSHFAGYDARRVEVGPGVSDLRVGGRYSLDDLDGALESIERVLPVRDSRGGGDSGRAGSRRCQEVTQNRRRQN